jgi:hypothetical protein
MDSSLHEVWQGAAGTPFLPTIGKQSQFFVGFVLLVIGILLTGVFALSMNVILFACFILLTDSQTGRSSTLVYSVFLPLWPLRMSLTSSPLSFTKIADKAQIWNGLYVLRRGSLRLRASIERYVQGHTVRSSRSDTLTRPVETN